MSEMTESRGGDGGGNADLETCALVSRQRDGVMTVTGGDTARCTGSRLLTRPLHFHSPSFHLLYT